MKKRIINWLLFSLVMSIGLALMFYGISIVTTEGVIPLVRFLGLFGGMFSIIVAVNVGMDIAEND